MGGCLALDLKMIINYLGLCIHEDVYVGQCITGQGENRVRREWRGIGGQRRKPTEGRGWWRSEGLTPSVSIRGSVLVKSSVGISSREVSFKRGFLPGSTLE